jgi:hypothetical protein
MAVVIVTTAGAMDANCYCDIPTAEAYFQTRGWVANWTNATPDQQTAVLIWASRLLDLCWWYGVKTNYLSPMRWPRVGLCDRDGFIINYATIPLFIVQATAEWALALLGEDRTLDEGGLVQYGGKVGPITDPNSYARKPMPDSVRDMISPYLANLPAGSGRVGRM